MESITPAELAALGDDAVIIDVREVDEVAQVRVPGALNIPMSQFVDRIGELPEGTLYVMCAAGARSARVTEFLEQQGYDAINVSGGIGEWAAGGHPVERG
ncbi:rhodanese-like domain-containing protein [Rathayibacter sp. YIM 133350]|uniref:rhodanese-like domain-containing protein n=1 Tax=Rathayibacter sp. YIM 133350 TaxID=3131992 RepID=UPI00307E78DF